MVFYTIFAAIYLTELGVEGLGRQIDGGEGVALFFRMSLGGACVGIFFGLGLLFVLNQLNRRLNREENVVQVAAAASLAYLCYFTADAAWHTSGVIATVAMVRREKHGIKKSECIFPTKPLLTSLLQCQRVSLLLRMVAP